MAKIKTVKLKDIKAWVLKQPDDRKVNMFQSWYNSDCGCIMVQYGKEVLKKEFTTCGYSLWTLRCEGRSSKRIAQFEGDLGIGELLSGKWDDIKTFGDVKKCLL